MGEICGTTATILARSIRFISPTGLPKRRIAPSVGRSTPSISLSRVVLPAPLGPIRPRKSPFSIPKLTSRITGEAL
ncbi:MAG: hypothetical protein WCX84_07075 [Syntrophales bacterium]|nr:hypothetical protein [Syntrophales bacterium]